MQHGGRRCLAAFVLFSSILGTTHWLASRAADLLGPAALIEGLSCGLFLFADRAIDANWLRDTLTDEGIAKVILPKSNRRFPAEFDRDTYKWRYLIENVVSAG